MVQCHTVITKLPNSIKKNTIYSFTPTKVNFRIVLETKLCHGYFGLRHSSYIIFVFTSYNCMTYQNNRHYGLNWYCMRQKVRASKQKMYLLLCSDWNLLINFWPVSNLQGSLGTNHANGYFDIHQYKLIFLRGKSVNA